VDNVTRIKIDGTEYEIDGNDLTWGEVELLEKETGRPIGQLDFESATTMLVLAWLAKRRKEPLCSLDDLRALPMSAIEAVEDGNPTQAVEDGEVSTVDGTGIQS
jgi:hypothetical protein